MSKFFRLCSCEFTKIIKKKSTKVMLIILIISLFASAGFAILTKKMYSLSDEIYENIDYKSNLQSEMDSLKHEINENNDSLDESSKNSIQAKIDIYQFAIDNQINIYTKYWKTDVITSDLLTSKEKIYNYKSLKDEESEKIEQENFNRISELLIKDDFIGYINNKKEMLKKDFDKGQINQNEYDDELYVLNLEEKYEIGKVYNPDDKWKINLINEIRLLQNNVRSGIDTTTQKALTEETLKKNKNNIKINEYRIEHNMAPYMTGVGDSIGSTRKSYDYMVSSFSMMIIAVMIIIMAGSSISAEISKGTIKFWSFTPNKRWKILLSKFIVITFILIVTTVLMSLLSSLVGNIFFGSANAQDYIYVSNGQVHTINYIAFSIIYNLVCAIDVFVFLIFAMMLSTVARNTAVAVGISIAAYLGGSTIMQILNLLIKKDWMRFIPFNNLELSSRIFTNDMSYSATTLVSNITGNISVSFSLGVLGVCAILMIITMFDSFRKRDIV